MAFFQDTKPSPKRFINAPASVLWLIAIILAAHGARALLPQPESQLVLFDYAFVPARPDAALTYVSYLFVHGGFPHALINSLWLLAFGPPVAWRLGTARFLAFYFICGIIAALAHLLVDTGSPIPVVGASGAISGLMGGAIRILYGTRLAVYGDPEPQLAPVASRPVLFFAAIWTSVNIVVGIVDFGLTEEGELIAWVAHLGGFYAGLFGIGFFDRAPRNFGPV